MTSRFLSAAAAIGLIVMIALPAAAQSPAPAPSGGWDFNATPYLWSLGLDGEIGVGRLDATGVEASFSDIWDHLDIAAMAAFDGRKGRWGFVLDAFYADLSGTQPTPGGLFGDAETNLTQQIYTALAYYRVKEGPCAVDLLFGPRYTSVDTDLTLTSGVAAGRTASAGVSWWDALAGARVNWYSAKGWGVTGFAGVGGSGDDFTWEALAMGGYRFKKLVTLSVGYRYLSVDYDDGHVVYEMAMAGPLLGIGFRF